MRKQVICPSCEYVGRPRKKKRGSGKVELMGWLLFPLGVPYSLWRMFARYPVCKNCGNENLIEEDSIIGKKIMAKIEAELASIKPVQKKQSVQGVMPPERTNTVEIKERGPWRPEHDKDKF